MYETLRAVLANYVNEDRLWVFLEAYNALNTIGLSDQDTELLGILGLSVEMTDSDQLVGRIEACLVYAVGGCLHQYGLTVKEGTPLTVMASILLAVGTFERYHIDQGVQDMLNTDELDEIEKLAELIPLYCDLEHVDVIEYLTEVRPATLTRIKQIVADEMERQTTAQEPAPLRLQRVRVINGLLRDTDNQHPLLVRQVASTGVPMDRPIITLVEDNIDYLDEITDLKGLAWELFGLAVYSDMHYFVAYKKAVEYFTDDYREQTKLLSQVSEYLDAKGWTYVKA